MERPEQEHTENIGNGEEQIPITVELYSKTLLIALLNLTSEEVKGKKFLEIT